MATEQVQVPREEESSGPKSAFGKWIAKKRAEEVTKFGGRCQVCGNDVYEELQFAHVKETALSGMGGGRGSYARWKDVHEHPECYRLMCDLCHEVFDSEKNNPEVQKIYVEVLKL